MLCTNYITLSLIALAVFILGLTVRLVFTEGGNDWSMTSSVRPNQKMTERERRMQRVMDRGEG